MRISIDDRLIEEALALTGAQTARDAVHLALEALVKSRKKKHLADLAGRIRFRDDFDHKAARTLR
jgi:Arc/MetJ family transcription regulator